MKKVLSLVLAVIMVFGLSTAAFAVSPDSSYAGNNGKTLKWGLGYSTSGALYDGHHQGTVRPDSDIRLTLVLYNDAETYLATRENVRKDKIDVKIKVSEGSKAVKKAEIKYDNNIAYVKVSYIDPFVSTKELDFDYTVYLTKNKSRIDEDNTTYNNNQNTAVQIVGTLENWKTTVTEGDEYVYIYDYPLVEAEDYIKEIEVDFGQGLKIFTKMFEDKKYYGIATQEIKSEDDDVVNKYPSIDTIYYLQTINLNSAGNYVRIDVGDKMYVYNADLKYIGTTNDKLPYSTKYYVSSVELDVDDANLDDIPSGGDTDNVPGGGDDVPTNVNKNPGTGR